ncbi:NAD(P)H-hydrate dehydratase [Novosphingobium sp.]|uniref:NAD(P)H-hydrate dehydratase n=1 Tax=Novosphingobium sp. TaxID=1874826 RepID=UPI002736B841|nr:NAD(P)H-hydrate dehydratase [Novosphingobium sp.]MDP3905641.1 NAD(P)H-hydrate dehydratase [Novosphingobium sp.]
MQPPDNQILTAAQMRRAEEELIAGGTGVDQLMQTAGRGAADWVWRVSGGRPVTVLCGPGNNGGDGYVIAQALHERGGPVQVIAASEPKTDAARTARALYHREVCGTDVSAIGEVLVDCLFGTGLTRALSSEHTALLTRLAASHALRVAVDLPSGVDSDTGQPLGPGLPDYDLTLALGAWKPAHFLMPACAQMGALRLVPIGVGAVPDAAALIARPRLHAPVADAHKYTRGLLVVIGGAMPGAARLAATAAQGSGAGYVKLLGEAPAPDDIVADPQPLANALTDTRINALLIGPGLGRDAAARERLTLAMAENIPAVLDADALVLLTGRLQAQRTAPLIATPHEGELAALERAFGCAGEGGKVERARALAQVTGMVIVAKGADTVIAAPDGRTALAARASSWLSTAGTGDVLAGTIASRLASGADPFAAACDGVWLHGEAARRCPPAFTAGMLAAAVRSAYAACL